MRIAFHLAHPAHFHLFRNVVGNLREKHDILITYNAKDVLENLVNDSSLKDISRKIKTNDSVEGKVGLTVQFIRKNIGVFKAYRMFKPDLVLGTSIIISLTGRLLGFDNIIVNEDDFDIVQKTANLGYPHATWILCPSVCRTGKFSEKCLTYEGYHELAYLHPDNFNPSKEIAEKYVDISRPYFILRFAKLVAHHDSGIKGISSGVARELIEILAKRGRVYITSERQLETELEPYRIAINPIDMHHVLAYASVYIGDSQTMAAEAGVLGTPFIRFNDFVGRISYLDELENVYGLGFGVRPAENHELPGIVQNLIETENINSLWQEKREKMLAEKIDLSKYLTWFINNYPKSVKELKKNPDK